MENLLVENEIFCDLDSIKLDLDSDLFDLSPFEFEHAAATATGAETVGEPTEGDLFADVGKTTPKMEVKAALAASPDDNDEAKVALSSLSSLLSPPSTPVITSNNLQQPSWNLESLLKARQPPESQNQQRQQHQSSSSVDGMFTSLDAQPPPPNKNIINHQDKNVIQQILDGLQQQPATSASSSAVSGGVADHQARRPIVVVSAIQDETQKNSLPKFKLEMIKEAASLTTPSNASSTASRTLVPETNHPIMLQKPLIAKDQKTGSLQLLPESLILMDGKILSLGDLLSASGLHKNLICTLDIKPATTTTPSGSLTPPINSASSVNFGQYPQQQQPLFSKASATSSSPKAAGMASNNDHSQGLVHKLLASPINQLIQPWQTQQRSSFDPAKSVPGSGAEAAAALFPTHHSAFGQRKSEKTKPFVEATSLEDVFPDSFCTNKVSSATNPVSNANVKNGDPASSVNWTGEPSFVVNNAKASSENSLRSVIKNNIIKSKQQKSAAAAVSVKREVVDAAGGVFGVSASGNHPQITPADDLTSRAAAVGVFMENAPPSSSAGASGSFAGAVTQVGRGAISMPSSPVSFRERESFFDAFVKTDLDEIIPEPLDNDCIICGVAFQTQAALRDHLEEHRDHISMIQSGGGQSASLIDSPPYSSNSSVVGSEEINNGTSSGCPSMADAAEFYVNASMPASPASSTSSLDQIFATTNGSPVRGVSGNGAPGTGSFPNNNNKKIDAGSTLASLLVSNISPLLSSMDAAAAAAAASTKSGPTPMRQQSYPGQRSNHAFGGQNLLSGSTVGGINTGSGNGAMPRNGFVTSLFQQQQQQRLNAGMSSLGGGAAAAKWKKTSLTSGVGMPALLGGVGGGSKFSSVNDSPQFFGKIGDGKKPMKMGESIAAGKLAGQKRKLPGMAGMGVSKSCPGSPAMKEMMMGGLGGNHLEGHLGGMAGVHVGGMSGSDMMAAQGPKTKKCRRVYGLNQKNLWCTQCQWKKACARFKPPKQ